jgi:hypothetical protein
MGRSRRWGLADQNIRVRTQEYTKHTKWIIQSPGRNQPTTRVSVHVHICDVQFVCRLGHGLPCLAFMVHLSHSRQVQCSIWVSHFPFVAPYFMYCNWTQQMYTVTCSLQQYHNADWLLLQVSGLLGLSSVSTAIVKWWLLNKLAEWMLLNSCANIQGGYKRMMLFQKCNYTITFCNWTVLRHFHRNVRELLNRVLQQRWIGRAANGDNHIRILYVTNSIIVWMCVVWPRVHTLKGYD